MEALVIAAAELRRRVKVEDPKVLNIRCGLVITPEKLMLEPLQLRYSGVEVWMGVDHATASRLAVIVADCPDE